MTFLPLYYQDLLPQMTSIGVWIVGYGRWGASLAAVRHRPKRGPERFKGPVAFFC